jgi:hypothetical protein
MVVNFRTRGISQNTRKLAPTVTTLIKKIKNMRKEKGVVQGNTLHS